MSRREALEALIARVEAGETGWKLDGEIALAFGWLHQKGPRTGGRLWYRPGVDLLDRMNGTPLPPALTTSIDAQAALPGRIKYVSNHYTLNPPSWATSAITEGRNGDILAYAPTEPAARLAAHLRVMMETINDPS